MFGKSDCNREKWLNSGIIDCIWAKWLYLLKVVIFLQSGCTRAKWLYSGKSGYILAKWL